MSLQAGDISNKVLANIATDYTSEARKGLVGTAVFSHIGVSRATGQIAKFSRSDLLHVPDAKLANTKATPKELEQSHSMQDFACLQYALRESVAYADLEKADGPFPRAIENTIWRLVAKLELAKEQRIANEILALSGSDKVTSLSGDGTGETNQWSGKGGKPLEVITAKLDAMTIRGNTIILPRSVWNKIQFHADIIAKLPSTAYQTLTVEALGALFGVERVLIANGALKSTAKGTITSIWGNNVILAYVDGSGDKDAPTAGRVLLNEYADGATDGWIIRQYDDASIGMKGGRYYSVGQETDEVIICPELMHVIKDVV